MLGRQGEYFYCSVQQDTLLALAINQRVLASFSNEVLPTIMEAVAAHRARVESSLQRELSFALELIRERNAHEMADMSERFSELYRHREETLLALEIIEAEAAEQIVDFMYRHGAEKADTQSLSVLLSILLANRPKTPRPQVPFFG